MRFWAFRLGCVALVCAATVACGGSDSTEAAGDPADAVEVASAPEELIEQSWPVKMATEQAFQPYAAKKGWVDLVMKRHLKRAVEDLGPGGGLDAARVHADTANLFRQAALLSSNALIETYGKTPEPTDPVGVAHLLTVAHAITGDNEQALAASKRLDGVEDPTNAWHGPWRVWLDAGGTWPPDLSGLPLELPEVQPGVWPQLLEHPSYALPEQNADTERDMADPSLLVALMLWHEAAAIAAAGDKADQVASYAAGYRIPAEGPVTAPVPLDEAFLFGSDLLVPGDGPFMADVHGPSGADAVEKHKGTSLIAALAAACRDDSGRIDAERAADVLAQFRTQVLARSSAQTNDKVQIHQRAFADIAMVGAFRNLALVSEVEGDREAAGLLRINAMEKSDKATACPVGLVALGAWDASNRYPTRAQDILHAQARRFPSLEAARYGLDVMALRVSRERPGETPGI